MNILTTRCIIGSFKLPLKTATSPTLILRGFLPIKTIISPLLNPFFCGNPRNLSLVILFSVYHTLLFSHHDSNPELCSMLDETTATTGYPVPNNNPSPGYIKNLTMIKAKIILTIQEAALLSFHIKCQIFFSISLKDIFHYTNRWYKSFSIIKQKSLLFFFFWFLLF